MSTTHFHVPTEMKQLGRRTGYVLAVLVNLAILFVVVNALEWGAFPWVTDDFSTVVPWIGSALGATAALNLVYLFKDTQPFRSLGQILVNLITIAATSQVFRVFPFDFSPYDFGWEVVARLVLALAMVGAGIGVIAETVKLASAARAERR